MVLILISWIYLFFTSINLGITLYKLLKIKELHFIFISFFGLFLTTLFASIWALFGGINSAFHLVLLLLNILIFIQNKKLFKETILKLKHDFLAFSKTIKILLGITFLLILAQCAAAPFIVDNETYYIQTIKWLNEYGFVKGLANLHLFFGQTSGWHITQSVFNFSFLYDRFNDLNGYCLLLANYFAFQKLNAYFTNSNKINLLFGLLPLANVFFFQFISSPSPDLPVYILSFLIFAIYLENESKSDAFSIISILVLFAIFIKITAVVLLLFPFLIFLNHFSELKNRVPRISLLALISLLLFVSKNTILTGYPLFPLAFFRWDSLSYTIPKEIMDFFFSPSMLHSFYIPYGTLDTATVFDILKQYFLGNGIDSIIALSTLIMVVISPIVIAKYFAKKTTWTIYLAFILLLSLLCFSSPQYRFYVHFTIFFGLLLLTLLLSNKKLIVLCIELSLVIVVVLVFVPLSFIGLTQNKSLAANSTFHLENTIFPKPNTKEKEIFKKANKGDLDYYTPTEYSFFWITGNGDLPCVTSEQLDYFETNFHYIPQLRGQDLKDGFYAQKVTPHD